MSPETADLNLYRGLTPESRPGRIAVALVCSAAFHMLLLAFAVRLPSLTKLDVDTSRRVVYHRTPLYLPPDLPGRRATLNNSAASSPPPPLIKPRPQTKTAETKPHPVEPLRPKAPEPPVIAADKPPALPPALPVPAPAPPPAPAKAEPKPSTTPAKPAGPFQDIGNEPVNPKVPLKPQLGVDSAIRGLRQSLGQTRPDHPSVNDNNEPPAMPGRPGSDGEPSPHAAIQMQSDAQGVDFQEYLTRVLTVVRTNWKRVIPASVREGQVRGRTVVEFIIDRDGKIPKMVIATSSGSEPLDRAAGAGLSMSNLPPLPADYHGFQVRLAFTFSYNMPNGQ